MNTVKKLNFISIPYAGGNSFSFKNFGKHLEPYFNCVFLELPGRGRRAKEQLLDNIQAMVDDLYQQIRPYLSENFVLYGHSMGGILGNELIHKIQSQGANTPLLFVVTGCQAPQFRQRKIVLHQLDDTEFQHELQKLGGFPDAILQEQELMSFLLPILRADIKALEIYQYKQANRHSTPITLITGDQEELNEDQILGWKEETTGRFQSYVFKGNHFFIYNQLEALTNQVRSSLRCLHCGKKSCDKVDNY